MSFGVGVGDFIAVGTLIVKIINSLHGAQSEYRELTRELEGYVQSRSEAAGLSKIISTLLYVHDHGLISIQSTKSFKPSR